MTTVPPDTPITASPPQIAALLLAHPPLVLGRLFGTTDKNRDRQELIVLIMPTVIRGGKDAKHVTDDYQT